MSLEESLSSLRQGGKFWNLLPNAPPVGDNYGEVGILYSARSNAFAVASNQGEECESTRLETSNCAGQIKWNDQMSLTPK